MARNSRDIRVKAKGRMKNEEVEDSTLEILDRPKAPYKSYRSDESH